MLTGVKVYACLSFLQLVYLAAGYLAGRDEGGTVSELEEADKIFGWIVDYTTLDNDQILRYQLLLVTVKNFQK